MCWYCGSRSSTSAWSTCRIGGADDQHQPARGHDDFLEHLRQLQFLDAGDRAADRADHHADLAALLEHVDAEAPRFLQRQRHVQFQVAFELRRSEEHTSELQSLILISYAVFCLKKKKPTTTTHIITIY